MVDIPEGSFYEQRVTNIITVIGTRLLIPADSDRVYLFIDPGGAFAMRFAPDPGLTDSTGFPGNFDDGTFTGLFRDFGDILGREWYYADTLGGANVYVFEILYRTDRRIPATER